MPQVRAERKTTGLEALSKSLAGALQSIQAMKELKGQQMMEEAFANEWMKTGRSTEPAGTGVMGRDPYTGMAAGRPETQEERFARAYKAAMAVKQKAQPSSFLDQALGAFNPNVPTFISRAPVMDLVTKGAAQMAFQDPLELERRRQLIATSKEQEEWYKAKRKALSQGGLTLEKRAEYNKRLQQIDDRLVALTDKSSPEAISLRREKDEIIWITRSEDYRPLDIQGNVILQPIQPIPQYERGSSTQPVGTETSRYNERMVPSGASSSALSSVQDIPAGTSVDAVTGAMPLIRDMKVITEKEYEKLPVGTPYKHPDGNVYIKQ